MHRARFRINSIRLLCWNVNYCVMQNTPTLILALAWNLANNVWLKATVDEVESPLFEHYWHLQISTIASILFVWTVGRVSTEWIRTRATVCRDLLVVTARWVSEATFSKLFVLLTSYHIGAVCIGQPSSVSARLWFHQNSTLHINQLPTLLQWGRWEITQTVCTKLASVIANPTPMDTVYL